MLLAGHGRQNGQRASRGHIAARREAWANQVKPVRSALVEADIQRIFKIRRRFGFGFMAGGANAIALLTPDW